MGTKRKQKQKKNKLPSTKKYWQNWDPNLPPQFQFNYMYWHSKQQKHTSNLGSTKSWRGHGCHHNEEPGWPQLYCSHYIDSSIILLRESVTCRILPPSYVKIPSKFTPIKNVFSGRSGVYINLPVAYVKLTHTGPTLMVDYGYQIEYECNKIDPFDSSKRPMQFTSVIKVKDNLYALSVQGTLAVMEQALNLTIIAISSNRVVPSVSFKFFTEYLCELNGDIFLVFLIHQKSIKTVEEVEVHRLEFPGLKWNKIERLQDNSTLFLDGSGSVWVVPSDKRFYGCKENCIYFNTQGSENGWWVYEMESGCISAGFN